MKEEDDWHKFKDLAPQKDPKGGSPQSGIDLPPINEPKKPKSDQIRRATVGDYIKAHSHPNGDGWHGFLKSNLFTALVIFFLGQCIVIAGVAIGIYWRTSSLIEWKVSVDATLKRMDDQDTIISRYANQRQDMAIVELQTRTKAQGELETQLAQLVTTQSERNNQQDKEISIVQAQTAAMGPTLVEIRAKLNFVADLLDERTKNKK